MTPIWKKSKSETTQEELNNFYKEHFFDMNDPVRVIQTKTEGSATYSALLFIPEKPPPTTTILRITKRAFSSTPAAC